MDKVRDEFTDADGVLHDWRGKPVDAAGQPRAGIWDRGISPVTSTVTYGDRISMAR